MPVDTEKANELSLCVADLCSSGEPKLDEPKLHSLKRLCKLSDDYVRHCCHAVMQQLEKPHAEVRLSAFQIIEKIFSRSHCFREMLLDDFQRFLELTLEINPSKPLPPPANAAKSLKNAAYAAVKGWHTEFAHGYKKLDIAYNYLKSCHKVDFNASELVSSVQRRVTEEQSRRQAQHARKQLQKVITEMEEGMMEISVRITELDECLNLLLPRSDHVATDGQRQQTGRHAVIETADNADVVRAFLEARKLTCSNKYLSTLTRWLGILQKNGGAVALLQRLIDTKSRLQAVTGRAGAVRIRHPQDESDSEDESFIEIPMAELSEADYLMHRICGESQTQAPLSDSLPSSSDTGACEAFAGSREGSAACIGGGAAQRSIGHAPTVNFDLDIEYWENPQALRLPESVPPDTPYRFWLPKDDNECAIAEAAHDLYRSRTIEFSGKFVPVERACGAPLPNGKLCNRMDRIKCPFHGKIIARNPDGTPVAGEACLETCVKAVPDWQDPALLADIQAATGLDLRVKKGKKRAAKGTTSRLTNIKATAHTPRSRLERKVLNKSAMLRVAESLDTLDKRRHSDKFCHTFVSTFSR